MLTVPTTLFQVVPGVGLIALNQGQYQYVTQEGDGQEVAKVVQAVPGMNVLFYNAQIEYPGSYISTDNGVTGFWGIKGTYTDPSGSASQVWESAASLFDRQSHPNPFVDRNPDGTVGGPNIKITQVAPGLVQLSWGK